MFSMSILAVNLGRGQTPHFTWAESNANEGEQRVFLICIQFGSCEEHLYSIWPGPYKVQGMVRDRGVATMLPWPLAYILKM